MRHLTPSQLKEYLLQAEPAPLLLDVREPWEFQICAIEGSSLMPMGQIPSCIEKLDPQRETVIICHHGIRSRQTGYYLERMGFSNLINLDGGVEAWAREVDPDMQTY
jgi:rhodanese-related sulfurtransferase